MTYDDREERMISRIKSELRQEMYVQGRAFAALFDQDTGIDLLNRIATFSGQILPDKVGAGFINDILNGSAVKGAAKTVFQRVIYGLDGNISQPLSYSQEQEFVDIANDAFRDGGGEWASAIYIVDTGDIPHLDLRPIKSTYMKGYAVSNARYDDYVEGIRREVAKFIARGRRC